MSTAEPLLSKIVDENDVRALDRLGILREHFTDGTERAAYDFIQRYAAENKGAAPSYATLVGAVPDFTYVPAVTDSYEYLARKLKESAGKVRIREFLSDTDGEINRRYAEIGKTGDIESFVTFLTERLDRIKIGTHVRNSVGIDIAKQSDKFLAEYRARAAGKSSRLWRSKFPGVNKAIGGGYYSSNMYTVYARSGRGKSVITMEEAIEMAFQGATVLVWALEMGWFEWMARAFSSISARLGIAKATIDGVDYDAGFENQALQGARLTPEYEAALERFVAELNDMIPGRIVLKAANDAEFTDRSLAALKTDILETGADVVIVDPFYYMDYEANTSKTAGGDAAATSKKLRIMTGALDIVTIAVTQADEDASEKDSEGVRELKPPKRAEIKKTKQLLEDAAALIGIDTLAHEGRGVIEIGKGRNGGEDTRIEIVYLPNYGIVREPDTAAMAAQFTGQF